MNIHSFLFANMNNHKEKNKSDENSQIKAAAEQWVNILFLHLQHKRVEKNKSTSSKRGSNILEPNKNNYAKSTI